MKQDVGYAMLFLMNNPTLMHECGVNLPVGADFILSLFIHAKHG